MTLEAHHAPAGVSLSRYRRDSTHLFLDDPIGDPPELEFEIRGVDASEEINQHRDTSRPTGLVTGAEPGAVVPVEVFVEQDQIAPVRIVLELVRPAVDRPSPACPEPSVEGSRRKVVARRRDSSLATSNNVMYWPEPVGH